MCTNTLYCCVYTNTYGSLIVCEQNNLTALHYASWNGHKEILKILLASKADVNTRNKVSH